MNFLDIRNHGFLRVATVVPEVFLANPVANVQEHLRLIDMAYEEGVQYALFPELSLTGYSCGDLFQQVTLQVAAIDALEELLIHTAVFDMIITVGMPLVFDGRLFNTAVTIYQGEILMITPKSYPPNYREFYEARYFARADESLNGLVNLLDQEVPFGTKIILDAGENFRLHVEICEDGWVPIPPSTTAALASATVLANASASNIVIGKSEYRESLMVTSSGRNLAVQMYCSAGFGESTSDVAWDGHGIIAERGTLLARSERFQLVGHMTIADVDLQAIDQERMRQGSFSQNAADHFIDYTIIQKLVELGCSNGVNYNNLRRQLDPHPFVPSDPSLRDIRCRETFMIQATALARRLSSLPPDKQKLFVALSGGQDSTHALAVSAKAVDLLSLPRSNIYCITMQGFGTTDRTYQNACALAKAFGAQFFEVPIVEPVRSVFAAIGHEEDRYDLTYENCQAWMRKMIELAYASKFGGIVVGSGDLSELNLGWCTMFGDHASHYGVNAGVPKTLISYLIAWTADEVFKDEEEVQKVLRDILATEISPELLPPDENGKILQSTEEKIGPYELHDFFGYWFIRFGFSPVKIARLALEAFDGKYDILTIKKWLKVFISRFFASQYKRNCLPDGPKVGLAAISPRGDWRMPADADVTIWLQELEQIPDTL